MSNKVEATFHGAEIEVEIMPDTTKLTEALAKVILDRRRNEYAQTITQTPGYTYRHSGPCLQRAIDMLIARDWDREQLAVEIQNWFDAQWCFPLNTKTPQPSSYSLADHLLAAREPRP